MFLKKIIPLEVPFIKVPFSAGYYATIEKYLQKSEFPQDFHRMKSAELIKLFCKGPGIFLGKDIRESLSTTFKLEFLSADLLLNGDTKKADKLLRLHDSIFGRTQRFNIEILDPSISKQKTISAEYAGLRITMNFDLESFKNLVTLESDNDSINNLSTIVRIQSGQKVIEYDLSKPISDKKTIFSHSLNSDSSFDWNKKMAITIKITKKGEELPELVRITGFKKREQ